MHSLQGFIAAEDVAREFEHSFNEGNVAQSIGLPQGFGLVPMTPELRERLADVTGEAETPLDEFSELTRSAMWVANMLSQVGKVVYIETDSEAGVQSAMVWEFDKVIFEPQQSATAANDALKLLGVTLEGADSEYAALGLNGFATTAEWYQAAFDYQLPVSDTPLELD